MKLRIKRSRFLAVAVMAVSGFLYETGHAQTNSNGFDFDVIIQSGDTISGGVIEGTFNTVSASNFGAVFSAFVTDANNDVQFAIISSDGLSAANVIALSGSTVAPGDFINATSGTIGVVTNPVINDSGQIAFNGGSFDDNADGDNDPTTGPAPVARLLQSNFDGSGLAVNFRSAATTVSFPSAPGATFVGTPPDQVLNFPLVTQLLNGSGEVLFDTFGLGANNDSNNVLLLSDGTAAGAATLARESQIATGISGVTDPVFAGTGLDAIGLTDNGTVIFSGSLSGTDITTGLAIDSTNDSVLVSTSDGENFTLIAREGTTLPGRNGNFGALTSEIRTSQNGQVLIHAEGLTGTDGGASDNSGIFTFDPTSSVLSEILANGDQVDPTNSAEGTFSSFSEFSDITESGLFAFFGEIAGTTEGNRGFFLGDANTGLIDEIIRAGDATANGAASEFIGAEQFSIDAGSDNFAINESGQIVFTVGVDTDPGPAPALESTLFFFDPTLGLIEVIAEGDALFGSTLEDFDIAPDALDDSGRFVIEFELEDGTTGVTFVQPVQTVPEPSAVALLGLGLLGAASRRRRRSS